MQQNVIEEVSKKLEESKIRVTDINQYEGVVAAYQTVFTNLGELSESYKKVKTKEKSLEQIKNTEDGLIRLLYDTIRSDMELSNELKQKEINQQKNLKANEKEIAGETKLQKELKELADIQSEIDTAEIRSENGLKGTIINKQTSESADKKKKELLEKQIKIVQITMPAETNLQAIGKMRSKTAPSTGWKKLIIPALEETVIGIIRKAYESILKQFQEENQKPEEIKTESSGSLSPVQNLGITSSNSVNNVSWANMGNISSGEKAKNSNQQVVGGSPKKPNETSKKKLVELSQDIEGISSEFQASNYNSTTTVEGPNVNGTQTRVDDEKLPAYAKLTPPAPTSTNTVEGPIVNGTQTSVEDDQNFTVENPAVDEMQISTDDEKITESTKLISENKSTFIVAGQRKEITQEINDSDEEITKLEEEIKAAEKEKAKNEQEAQNLKKSIKAALVINEERQRKKEEEENKLILSARQERIKELKKQKMQIEKATANTIDTVKSLNETYTEIKSAASNGDYLGANEIGKYVVDPTTISTTERTSIIQNYNNTEKSRSRGK